MTQAKRPSLLTFAAVMMFLVALFNLVSGISVLLNAPWAADLKVDFGNNLWIVGVIDLIIAVGCAFAGYGILNATKFGYYWAMTFAVVNGVKWFFMMPWQPFMAVIVLIIDLLIIFALATNPEYFGFAFLGEYSPPTNYD